MAGFSVNIGADVTPLINGLSNARNSLSQFNNSLAPVNRNINLTNLTFSGIAPAANRAGEALSNIRPGANQAANALTNVGRVAQDLPFGFIGIQNNLNPLLESFQRLRVETGSGRAALSALGQSLMGPAGIGIALSIVSSAFVIAQNGIAGFNSKAKEAKDRADELAKTIRSFSLIQEEAIAGNSGQLATVNALAAAVSDSNKPYIERKRALDELKEINKAYFNDLTLEDAATGKLTKTVKAYTEALISSAIQKGYADEIAKVAKAVADSDDEIAKSRIKLREAQEKTNKVLGASADYLREEESKRPLSNRLTVIRKEGEAEEALSIAMAKSTDLLAQKAVLTDKLNKAVAEGLKYKDLDAGKETKEEDLLKKRLEALEKIKSLTKDATALVGLQEAIFELQVKIAVRDQGKNQISKQELDQQVQGYKTELQKAFENQAIELEAIPKVRFSEVVLADISFKEVESKIAKATGFDKKIPTITVPQVRINFEKEGLKFSTPAALINAFEAAAEDFKLKAKGILQSAIVDSFVGIGEGIGEGLAKGDITGGIAKAGENLLQIIGSVIADIGKQMIIASKLVITLQKVLESVGFGPASLGVGIALIAVGSAIKNIKFNTPKFATGGIVTGPVIGQIGEMHRPEVIMPLDRLPQMLRSVGGGAAGDTQPVLIFTNEGLYFQMKKGERRAGRKF